MLQTTTKKKKGSRSTGVLAALTGWYVWIPAAQCCAPPVPTAPKACYKSRRPTCCARPGPGDGRCIRANQRGIQSP